MSQPTRPRRHQLARAAAWSALVLALAAGCSSGPSLDRDRPFQDGVFEGQSGPDEEGAIGHVTITVRQGAVAQVDFVVIGADGQPKDETYGLDSTGQIANQAYYRQAQAAVAAFPVYARQLVEVGYPEDVDVISGATWAHDQFVEAATAALLESQDRAESTPA